MDELSGEKSRRYVRNHLAALLYFPHDGYRYFRKFVKVGYLVHRTGARSDYQLLKAWNRGKLSSVSDSVFVPEMHLNL